MASFDYEALANAQDFDILEEIPSAETFNGENEEHTPSTTLSAGLTPAFAPARAHKNGFAMLTGDELLDTKIATGNLSKYDIYTAKKAGIDVMAIMANINANVNLDAKVRNKSSSTTKLRQDFYENMKALKAVDNIVESADDEAKGGVSFQNRGSHKQYGLFRWAR